MLFFRNRVLLAAISAFALLQLIVAHPLPLIKDNDLVKRTEALKNAPLEHDYVRLYRRGKGDITKEPKANPYQPKTKPASAPVEKARPPNNQNKRKALPNNTKLKLADTARAELDKIGVHGKERRNMIKWHKTQVKNEMKNNPLLKDNARTGVIQHLAHEGGSVAKEKTHITATFRDKDNKQIPNDFNGGNNHHVYAESPHGLMGQGKAALNRNNADIRGQSEAHQKTLSKTRTPGKSSNKGKGKQNPDREFSKQNTLKEFSKEAV